MRQTESKQAICLQEIWLKETIVNRQIKYRKVSSDVCVVFLIKLRWPQIKTALINNNEVAIFCLVLNRSTFDEKR